MVNFTLKNRSGVNGPSSTKIRLRIDTLEIGRLGCAFSLLEDGLDREGNGTMQLRGLSKGCGGYCKPFLVLFDLEETSVHDLPFVTHKRAKDF